MRISDWSSDVCSSDLGPEQIGLAPKSAPAASAAFGEIIMPERSASCARSVASGALRVIFTWYWPVTASLSIDFTSLLRRLSGSGFERSMLAFTASALKEIGRAHALTPAPTARLLFLH